MSEGHRNQFGQAIGFPLPDWSARPRPPRAPLEGRFCRVEPLDPQRHAADLYAAYAEAPDGRDWTYLPWGPFATFESYRERIERACSIDDPFFHAILDRASGQPVGVAAYLRIEPAMGSIEVGGLAFSPRLQRRPAATEAMYLMMRRAFDELGYRRYEWKCDALNARSRAAALRLGFQYEGLFRQAWVYKGRNRDTAWFSVIDRDWPVLRDAFERWLAPENFDAQGRQRQTLAELRGGKGEP